MPEGPPSFLVLVAADDATDPLALRASAALRAELAAALSDYVFRFVTTDDADDLFNVLPIRGAADDDRTSRPRFRAPTDAEIAEVEAAIVRIVESAWKRKLS